MEMSKLEKVIKGLEYHLKELTVGKTCFECPYCGDNPCEIQLIADTVVLLKEQKTIKECLKKKCVICPHCENCDVDENGLLKEKEALIIKKTKEPYGYGVYGGICPKCLNWIQSAHSFCGFCGQAVKWND